MCGRYVSPDEAAIERERHIGRHNNNPFKRRFNVGPTSLVPQLLLDPATGELELALARWGLIPQWWKDDKPPRMTHNARMEEAASKPMWRQALRQGRCLIPAEGWHEWQETQSTDPATGEITAAKQPQFLYLPRRKLFCLAGVMASWTHAGDFLHHAVSTRVNSTRNDDEMLIEALNIPTGS